MQNRQNGYFGSFARNAITQLASLYPEELNAKATELGFNGRNDELQYLINQGIASRDPEAYLRTLFESEEPGSKQQDMAMMALICLLYTSPSPRDATLSRMPSSA